MEILLGGRQTGKTTALIKKAAKEWLYIVCLNHARVKDINNKAIELGLDIPFPICLNELPLRSSLIDKVLVDDLDSIIESMIGRTVELATVTKKEVNT